MKECKDSFYQRNRATKAYHGVRFNRPVILCPSVLTGRLLRANHIIFNWDRLASWIHMTEEWPYRTSWIILFLEETDGVSDQVTLKTLYERYTQIQSHCPWLSLHSSAWIVNQQFISQVLSHIFFKRYLIKCNINLKLYEWNLATVVTFQHIYFWLWIPIK